MSVYGNWRWPDVATDPVKMKGRRWPTVKMDYKFGETVVGKSIWENVQTVYYKHVFIESAERMFWRSVFLSMQVFSHCLVLVKRMWHYLYSVSFIRKMGSVRQNYQTWLRECWGMKGGTAGGWGQKTLILSNCWMSNFFFLRRNILRLEGFWAILCIPRRINLVSPFALLVLIDNHFHHV